MTAESKVAKKGGYGQAVDAERWQLYLLKRSEGMSVLRASNESGISRSTTMRAERGDLATPEWRRAKSIFDALHPKAPVTDDKLSPEARRAVNDFGYFRKRYLGRVTVPWVNYSANLVAEMLATPHKEYALVNQPPGVGKTTFWTIDLVLWLICRNRAVRILIGSAAQDTAALNVQQIRRELEREVPYEAPEDLKRKGLAVDAEATIPDDFGNFKPPRGEMWTANRFVVVQSDGSAKSNKEPTVSSFGMDSRFLGNRVDFAVWDDVVDAKAVNTAEKRESVGKWFAQYAETRIEPGGLLVLQGQRLHAEDLYWNRRNVEIGDYGDDNDPFAEPQGFRKKYRHVLFKAHYQDHCKGEHSPLTAKPYDPEDGDPGCLLDPRRLMFRDLMGVKDEDARLFTVTYQQEDTDPASVLVPIEWVNGGHNPETGEDFLGCWDRERSTGVIPTGLTKPWELIVSADPSPTKYWSVQMWMMHIPTEQRILVDHYRGKLEAPDFLGWDLATQTWTGLLETWWQSASRQGHPFKFVIVEHNAAQNFLTQYDHVKKWEATRGVSIRKHYTTGNKTDPDFGVQMVAPHWRHGRVRLPGNPHDGSRGRSMALVNEVTKYPEASTTDCLMAHWFVEHQWQRHLRAMVMRPAEPPTMKRPSWMGGKR